MAGTRRRMLGVLFSLALVLGFAPASAQPTFPALSGRVVDAANLRFLNSSILRFAT
jgi:hypothetical protein